MRGVAQQAVEKIDRTRAHAGRVFTSLIYNDPPISNIPHHDALTRIFPCEEVELKPKEEENTEPSTSENSNVVLWLFPGHTMPRLVQLLSYSTYRYHVVTGLVVSAGELTESLVSTTHHHLHALIQLVGVKTFPRTHYAPLRAAAQLLDVPVPRGDGARSQRGGTHREPREYHTSSSVYPYTKTVGVKTFPRTHYAPLSAAAQLLDVPVPRGDGARSQRGGTHREPRHTMPRLVQLLSYSTYRYHVVTGLVVSAGELTESLVSTTHHHPSTLIPKQLGSKHSLGHTMPRFVQLLSYSTYRYHVVTGLVVSAGELTESLVSTTHHHPSTLIPKQLGSKHSPGHTMPRFVQLLSYPTYRYHVVTGLVVSAGELTESLVSTTHHHPSTLIPKQLGSKHSPGHTMPRFVQLLSYSTYRYHVVTGLVVSAGELTESLVSTTHHLPALVPNRLGSKLSPGHTMPRFVQLLSYSTYRYHVVTGLVVSAGELTESLVSTTHHLPALVPNRLGSKLSPGHTMPRFVQLLSYSTYRYHVVTGLVVSAGELTESLVSTTHHLPALVPNRLGSKLSPGHTMPRFVQLLSYSTYRYHVVTGLVVSAGELTESLVKHTTSSLYAYLNTLHDDAAMLSAICDTIIQVFADNIHVKRITGPMFNFLDRLLSSAMLTAICDTIIQVFADNIHVKRITGPMFNFLDRLLSSGK
ncbi:hypothetical protein NE865_03572 [Phthorimaea operculella]|nr:hypothetical protein NE865_03572 [Phthorimaea operculella]